MLFYMLEQERSIKLLDPLLYWVCGATSIDGLLACSQ
jgi:hypothetical protein